jgi:hypothetical protein
MPPRRVTRLLYRLNGDGWTSDCAPFGTTRGPRWIGEHLLFGIEDAGNVHLYQVPADGTGKPSILVGGDRWVSEWDWRPGRWPSSPPPPPARANCWSSPWAPTRMRATTRTGNGP